LLADTIARLMVFSSSLSSFFLLECSFNLMCPFLDCVIKAMFAAAVKKNKYFVGLDFTVSTCPY
jgi:hypothetical protein